MRVWRLAVPGAALLAILLLPGITTAQSIVTGAVSGTITDPAGAVVSSSPLALTNAQTGESRTAVTNDGGHFLFSLLTPGAYILTLERAGFRNTRQAVDVLLGQTTTANIRLELGSTSQAVTVTATDQALQSEDGNVASNIDAKTIENIPNPGGDLTHYAQVVPGVMMNTTSIPGFGNFSAFGLPGTSNLFTINGNDYNDPYLNVNNAGSSNLLLGSNEVQEVAVVTNGYTGQYGRQAGAQVNYSTKSGSNTFHGDAVYDWNGSSLNANDFFLNSGGVPKPFENNNQWAASFGGPIKKDKAFFFVNTEGIRYVFGTATQVFVPDPALQTYVLDSVSATSPAALPFYQKMFALYNSAPGIARAVPVPNTPDANTSCGSLGGDPSQPFATASCLDSFYTSSSNGNREWFISARVDYDLSDKDKVSARVKFDRGLQPTYTDPISPLFNVQAKQPQDEGQLNYTHVFNPRVVNSFIGSVLYTSSIFDSPNRSAALSAFPYIYLSLDTNLTPLGVAGGTFPSIAPYPSGRNVTQWQLVDDLSIEHGNHLFKTGVNFRRDDISDWTASEGSYPVVQSFIADFAADTVDTIARHYAMDSAQPLASYSLGLYFQDQIRVNSRLNLTLALRADRNSGGSCQSNCVARAVTPFGQLNHDPTIPYNQMMTTGISQILPGVEAIVFQPRVGFAWSPLGNNTVIRGGVGLFTDLYPGLLLNYFTRNFPEVTSFSLVNDYSTTNFAMSPDEANSAAALINGCNTAFQTNFAANGTLSSFQGSAPAGCRTPNLNDAVNPLKMPKYIEWNFEVQHSLGSKTVLSANYVGNHGYDELMINPYLNGYGFGGLPAAAPDPRVRNVLEFTSAGISNYNGLTLSIQRRFWHGFQGNLNYTYSHSLDDISNGGLEQYSIANSLQYQIDPRGPQFNYASSDYDLRQYLSANYTWDIPIRSNKNWLNSIIGNWTASGTLFTHSGFPYSIVDGNTQTAKSGKNMAGITVLAQPLVSIPTTCASIDPNNPCYTPSDFAQGAAVTSFGGGRNAYRGPGYFNTDLSLRKTFEITERTGFMLGANFYNVLNHVNFANPNANLAGGANFGTITSTVGAPTSPYGAAAMAATDARIIQLTTKLSW